MTWQIDFVNVSSCFDHRTSPGSRVRSLDKTAQTLRVTAE
jgi:hypothetical protein